MIRTGDPLCWAMDRYVMCEKKKCAFNTVLVVVPQALKTLGAVVWTAVKVAARELRWSRCLSALCWRITWILYWLVQRPVTELIWVVTERGKIAFLSFELCRSGAAQLGIDSPVRREQVVCAHIEPGGEWLGAALPFERARENVRVIASPDARGFQKRR